MSAGVVGNDPRQGGFARAGLAKQEHSFPGLTGKVGERHPRTFLTVLELHALHLHHVAKVSRPNVRLDVASHTNDRRT